jgi:hypothetical protein
MHHLITNQKLRKQTQLHRWAYVSQQFKPCVIPDHRSVNLLSIVCCTSISSIEPSDDYSKIALEGKRHNLK